MFFNLSLHIRLLNLFFNMIHSSLLAQDSLSSAFSLNFRLFCRIRAKRRNLKANLVSSNLSLIHNWWIPKIKICFLIFRLREFRSFLRDFCGGFLSKVSWLDNDFVWNFKNLILSQKLLKSFSHSSCKDSPKRGILVKVFLRKMFEILKYDVYSHLKLTPKRGKTAIICFFRLSTSLLMKTSSSLQIVKDCLSFSNSSRRASFFCSWT